MASLPGRAKCHKTFKSHRQPQNCARKAVPLRAGAGNARGGGGTDAQQAGCGERQAEIRQGCRAARCAPAVGSYSLEGQQPGLRGRPAATLAELGSGGAPTPRGVQEPAGGVTAVCKEADGNNYPYANSMEISMCLGKRHTKPSRLPGQRFTVVSGDCD